MPPCVDCDWSWCECFLLNLFSRGRLLGDGHNPHWFLLLVSGTIDAPTSFLAVTRRRYPGKKPHGFHWWRECFTRISGTLIVLFLHVLFFSFFPFTRSINRNNCVAVCYLLLSIQAAPTHSLHKPTTEEYTHKHPREQTTEWRNFEENFPVWWIEDGLSSGWITVEQFHPISLHVKLFISSLYREENSQPKTFSLSDNCTVVWSSFFRWASFFFSLVNQISFLTMAHR